MLCKGRGVSLKLVYFYGAWYAPSDDGTNAENIAIKSIPNRGMSNMQLSADPKSGRAGLANRSGSEVLV